MASRCFCSYRHVRTLLFQWQRAGWLRWQGKAGRGGHGLLTFLTTPDRLGQQLLEMALAQLVNLLRPMMGGQWQNDTLVLRISYYRPLESVAPSSTWRARFSPA
ncbi:HTH-type transcriptional regulator SgrR|nr:HTH-type transcriptional regulator SgrR [Candidatus Pantoea persica]